MSKSEETIFIENEDTHAKVKLYNPYEKSASTESIALTDFVEDWVCELVEPKHSALTTPATVDPFAGGVSDWEDKEKQMLDLMHDKLGIGLASPQIGSSYNMFVMNHTVLGDIGVYKPEIVEFSEETVVIEEGCLTFPLLYIHITRPEKVKVKYFKSDGTTQVETWMDGIDARCFQHEFEHLQGELFLDKVSDMKLQRAFKKREKLFKKLEKKVVKPNA